jgi:hypothetical protein
MYSYILAVFGFVPSLANCQRNFTIRPLTSCCASPIAIAIVVIGSVKAVAAMTADFALDAMGPSQPSCSAFLNKYLFCLNGLPLDSLKR